MTQKKPQKTDNIGWILAFLFPKKGGPAKPASSGVQPSTAAQAATNAQAATAAPVSPPVQPSTNVLQPAHPAKPAPTAVQVSMVSKPAASTQAPSKQGSEYRPTLWTIASILSLIVNVILILVVVGLLLALQPLVGQHLVGGLYENFVLMDQANIKTTITVQTTIPVKFDLPVQTNTNVVLTEPTYIEGALVTLNTGGLSIYNAPANIVLPAGTSLPVALNITVPVDTTIPITLDVPVDIPLDQTELHDPFVGLKNVVEPFYKLFYPDQP